MDPRPLPDGPDLVTGSTGFVGYHLVKRLRDQGRAVRALVRASTDAGPVERLGAEVVRGDVTDTTSLEAAAKGCGRLFHVAGYVGFEKTDEPRLQAVNVGGVRNAVVAARANGIGLLVVTSSVAAVGGGEGTDPVDEDQPWSGDDRTGYAATKRAGEDEAREAAGDGLDVVCVNPGIVLGPEDDRISTGGEYVQMAARGKLPFAVNMLQGFVDVRDVADGHLLAAERGRSGERYILNTDSVAMPDFVERVTAAAGERKRPLVIPRWVLPPAAVFTEAWGRLRGRPAALTRERARLARRNAAFSGDRARRELGWSPRSLDETIADTVEWFRDAGLI
ncbi:MAG: NAD-dependent epimerase/dehydratase family protein [Planctomycetota bacterium]|jgi:dihydroflavonol-4-reductase